MKIFTATCHYCAKRITNAEDVFCIECYGRLPKTEYGFSEDNIVKDRFKGILPITRAGAFLYYNKNEMVKEILNQIKYKQNFSLSYQLGIICAQALSHQFMNHIDLIIPIPLHRTKQMLRGYNQTEYFGRGMSESLNIPLETSSIIRKVNTISQTALSRELRYRNVEDIFELKNETRLRDKNILLIDDVITTGATLESASQLILKSKPKTLNLFTLTSAFEL